MDNSKLSIYRPVQTLIIQQQTETMGTIRKWSQEAIETLQEAIAADDQDVLCDQTGGSSVTEYINLRPAPIYVF